MISLAIYQLSDCFFITFQQASVYRWITEPWTEMNQTVRSTSKASQSTLYSNTGSETIRIYRNEAWTIRWLLEYILLETSDIYIMKYTMKYERTAKHCRYVYTHSKVECKYKAPVQLSSYLLLFQGERCWYDSIFSGNDSSLLHFYTRYINSCEITSCFSVFYFSFTTMGIEKTDL